MAVEPVMMNLDAGSEHMPQAAERMQQGISSLRNSWSPGSSRIDSYLLDTLLHQGRHSCKSSPAGMVAHPELNRAEHQQESSAQVYGRPKARQLARQPW